MTKLMLLSDLHFGHLSRSKDFAVPGEPFTDETFGSFPFFEGMKDLARSQAPEYLLIAGDLTSKASPAEFKYCREKMLELANHAGIPFQKVIFALGNHDVEWNICKIAEQFTPEYAGHCAGYYQQIASEVALHIFDEIQPDTDRGPAPLNSIFIDDSVIIFVLNSGWKCISDQKVKHGLLSENQLDWLKNKLLTYHSSPQLKILLLHHHPRNLQYPVTGLDISTLEEGPEIMTLAGEHGVSLICHGHRHHPVATTVMESTWNAPITIICAGSASVKGHERLRGHIPNTIHFVEMPAGQEIHLINFQYTDVIGWCPVAPIKNISTLDHIMHLGQVHDLAERQAALSEIIAAAGPDKRHIRLPDWESLPAALRMIPTDTLNKLLHTAYDVQYEISGEYPEIVAFHKRR